MKDVLGGSKSENGGINREATDVIQVGDLNLDVRVEGWREA